jgi:hypothetical protein
MAGAAVSLGIAAPSIKFCVYTDLWPPYSACRLVLGTERSAGMQRHRAAGSGSCVTVGRTGQHAGCNELSDGSSIYALLIMDRLFALGEHASKRPRYSNCAKLGVDDTKRTDRALRRIEGKRLTYRPINGARTRTR